MNRNPFLSVFKRAEFWKTDLGYVGNSVQIFHKVSFGSEPYLIEIGDFTKITYGCKFITHDGGLYVLRNMYENAEGACIYGKIIVGKNCFLGNDVTILPGVTIGDNCVIAAGAVVTKSIPDNSIAAGIPCKVLRSIDEYYERAKKYFTFTYGMSYDKKKTYLLQLAKNTPFQLLKK